MAGMFYFFFFLRVWLVTQIFKLNYTTHRISTWFFFLSHCCCLFTNKMCYAICFDYANINLCRTCSENVFLGVLAEGLAADDKR